MDVRRIVGAVGRTLIGAGVLILLFVAYQLWGTGLAEARSQRQLTEEFRQALSAPTTTSVTTAPAGPDPAPPPVPAGEAVAIIKIPKIGVEKAVVEGVDVSNLKKGPGHYPGTPMPGQAGNAAVAGHRTTYGAPFFNLDELRTGDDILVTTREGRFRYEVTESRVVRPEETSVLQPTTDNRLTLTTCNPRFSAAQRLIVIAALRGEARPPPPPAPEEGPAGPAVASEASLSGRDASEAPAVLWGVVALVVWLLTWLLGRRWRKWPAYGLGAPVFLVVLFVFFENFSRLLPANY